MICLISRPLLIASRRDWYRSKGLSKGLSVAIETVRIDGELMEIWPNEVCDITVEFLSHHEVLQVLVVHPDLYQVPGSFQEMPPLFQYTDDSEHFLVMDLIIPFHRRQGFAVESH